MEKPHWLSEPELNKLITLLCPDGAQTRYVGGCVRDHLLGREVVDIDCATQLEPAEIIKCARAGGMKTIPTGLNHGTVTIVLSNRSVEVTTLRADVETDGRRAVVAYTHDWAVDAARRDFTVNALYMDAHGQITDPLGTGRADLEARHLRFVGDAKTRIAEDSLRILRFFRFMDVLDSYAEGDLVHCVENQSLMQTLSAERITQELRRMMVGAGRGLAVMQKNKVKVLGQYIDFKCFERVRNLQMTLDTVDEIVLLMAALGDVTDLSLSRAERRKVQTIESLSADKLKDLSLYINAYYLGIDVVSQAMILQDMEPKKIVKLLSWCPPPRPFTSEDVMADTGLKAGPELGQEIAKREQEWIAKITQSEEGLLH